MPYIIEVIIAGTKEVILVYARENAETSDYLLYDLHQGDIHLGTIFPQVNDLGEIDWLTYDLIARDLINEVGRQIEAKDL